MKGYNMEMSDRHKNPWQEAFRDAEIIPNESVWNRIDADLSRGEADGYRKRLLYVSLMAAASVVFAFSAGILGILNDNNFESNKEVIAQEKDVPEVNSLKSETEPFVENKDKSVPESVDENTASPNLGSINSGTTLSNNKNRENLITGNNEQNNTVETTESNLRDESIEIATLDKMGFQLENELPQSDPIITYYPPWKPLKKEEIKERFWAGIKVGSGNFDPNFNNTNDALALSDGSGSITTTPQSYLDQAITYSVGLNIGTKVWNRLIIHGGLQYAHHKSDGTTNQVLTEGATESPLLFGDVTRETASSTASTIDIENTFEFLSVPIQFGYLIVDQRFGWAVNTGIASNFFISNTVADAEGNFDKQTLKPGDETPFRPVYFDGIFSTELMYRFSDHYSLSLEPRYSLSLNSLTKSGSTIQSNPRAFIIGLRFKYIFRK